MLMTGFESEKPYIIKIPFTSFYNEVYDAATTTQPIFAGAPADWQLSLSATLNLSYIPISPMLKFTGKKREKKEDTAFQIMMILTLK